TNRIKQLNRSALDFAEGNLSCRTDIKGRDEIAELGISFNFMADKLEKMIQGNKDLAANISHELRSPLTRIKVSKELIQDRLDPVKDKDINRYVQNIDQDIDILDNLIDKILKLSKLDIQEFSLSIEQLDFKPLLTDLEKKYASSLKRKNLTLYKDINGPLLLNADKNIVTSVFSNLFDNAVKHTKENSSIHILAFKPADDILTFSITNTYRKLDPQELERLFEPFYRIENNKNPGSGLGLTIVKKLLKQCNGNIIAQNSEKGLTFEVRFSNQKLPY
ncbi:MAG: HAMP domain-containing histidine kinase, partial [Proteobacteria bacterium]|nr:HAMP domain-containing histidine kinase [Pseudomonadota bacterium]